MSEDSPMIRPVAAALALAPCLALGLASPAEAERRKAGQEVGAFLKLAAEEWLTQSGAVEIDQLGDRNRVEKVGDGSASVRQQGHEQSAQLGQRGPGNRSDVSQYGLANRARVDQAGAANYACLIQMGVLLDAEVVQTGRGRSAGVLQTPAGAQAIPPEVCFLERVGRKYVAQRKSGG
jgi:hypothetical protein